MKFVSKSEKMTDKSFGLQESETCCNIVIMFCECGQGVKY